MFDLKASCEDAIGEIRQGVVMGHIGNLGFDATLTTLYFVPIVYSYLRREAPVDRDRRIEEEYHAGEMAPGKA